MPVTDARAVARAQGVPLETLLEPARITANLRAAGYDWLPHTDPDLPLLRDAFLARSANTWIGKCPSEAWAPTWALELVRALRGTSSRLAAFQADRMRVVLWHMKRCTVHRAAVVGVLALAGAEAAWEVLAQNEGAMEQCRGEIEAGGE